MRIDAIAGTSMGAVVGGLYAAGYSVAELERLALTLDWQQVLSDDPPRQDIPYRRKQDDRDFLIKQKLSFRDDGSLGLPLGVIKARTSHCCSNACWCMPATPAISTSCRFRSAPWPPTSPMTKGGLPPRPPAPGDPREHVDPRGVRAGGDR